MQTFLEKIGRDCGQYADKFSSWEELFTMPSFVMKKKEIPVEKRRWILRWLNKYRQGYTPGIDK